MARLPQESDDLFVPVDAAEGDSLSELGLSEPRFLPSPLASTSEGLVCVGGRLSPDWLLDAYSHGIFPWPVWDDEPMAWWSLDPRAIIELDGLHISRRLARTLRRREFQVTSNRDFRGVIRGCATVDDRAENTWLTPTMIAAFIEMHELGHAHSIEVWRAGRLVGGTYGLAIGGLFAAESMFHLERDASKVALAHLIDHLRSSGFRLFDAQQWTPHTGRMGAVNIPRREYLRRLSQVTELPVTFGNLPEEEPLWLDDR